MTDQSRNIAILGATGSIGRNALEVVAHSNGRLKAVALSGHSNLELLCEQAKTFRPKWLIATDPELANNFPWPQLPTGCELLIGNEALEKVARAAEIDVVLAAIVGSAGLLSTWAAIDSGKRVALANKEAMVVAGKQMIQQAALKGAEIIPVDSEHSAIFQAFASGRREEVSKVVLTASGGPFREIPLENMAKVTVEDALNHPTWNMGPKITVDSATMMNKALEIIEARWLFDLAPEQINVMIHPQSIVHSMVEFVDGSVIAQLSPPDMKLPIQYALDYPMRFRGPASRIDWSLATDLQFLPPDPKRFPALALGFEVARVGGTSGAALNAANEAAVDTFLNGKLKFDAIVPACQHILDSHPFEADPSLDQLFEIDRWARQEIARWVVTL